MKRRLSAVIISVVLLSSGWLGGTGLTLLGAFVPLLWLSDSYGATRRDWWRVFGWAALTFVLWNAATIWWIWGATPVGPFAATLASTTLNMIAFMLYRTVSQRAPRALGYTLLTAGWIATEYWYTVGEFSWPWLILGNGFSHDVWAVQWYEYTGVFGGSLWVLVANIAIYEAWRTRSLRRAATAAAAVLVPAAVSLAIY
ncbi:MAG: apolipoprotein N-acyltransferase, partial [Alistipes sp.]|nr:apolipoprotein N-acyltransferase [Alistipes sp.]